MGTPDTRTVICSLAIDDSNLSNGCIRFIKDSGAKMSLRPHCPADSNCEEGHTLIAGIGEEEIVEHVEVQRGGITVHNEWVMHGSAGNPSDGWRRPM